MRILPLITKLPSFSVRTSFGSDLAVYTIESRSDLNRIYFENGPEVDRIANQNWIGSTRSRVNAWPFRTKSRSNPVYIRSSFARVNGVLISLVRCTSGATFYLHPSPLNPLELFTDLNAKNSASCFGSGQISGSPWSDKDD